jgi:hypothetical protein
MQPSRRVSRWLVLAAVLVLGFFLGGMIEIFLVHRALARQHDFMVHHHMLSPEMRGSRPSIPEHKRELDHSGLKRTAAPSLPPGQSRKPV